MKIVKKCVSCLNKNQCAGCREYCITFDDGEPYATIPITEELSTVTLFNSNNIKFEVYSSLTGKIVADNLQVYYDEDFEEFRIFPTKLYEKLELVYKEAN